MHAPRARRDGSGAVAQRGADPGRVLPRAAVWLVWTVSGVGVALGVLAMVYGGLNHNSLTAVLTSVAPQAVWAMSFPLVGAVIATHRPRNPLGWIFLVIGLSQGLTSFGHEYASYVFRTAPGATSLSAELMTVADHTMEPTLLSLWLRPPTERSQRSRH